MTEKCCSWLFEAESIQGYIYDSGRLRDAVGASQLIHRLCGDLEAKATDDDLLSKVLAGIGGIQIEFSRRGGGAFIAFFKDPDQRTAVRDLWPLAIADFAPGLAWVDAIGEGPDHFGAATNGMAALKQARLWRDADPMDGGAWIPRSTRTGGFLVIERDGEQPLADAPTRARRRAGRGGGSVVDYFGAGDGYLWPLKLSADGDDDDDDLLFPHLGEGHELVFVHADGNGLGAALHSLARACGSQPSRYLELYRGFSLAITKATRQAAADATKATLLPKASGKGMLPARPLILGGDDLGIILRPDVAVDFVEAYLQAFETRTQEQLGALHEALGETTEALPKRLTAAAGMAMVGASYPFAKAVTIAEALCTQCKTAVKAEAKRAEPARDVPLSSLLLVRQTSALPFDDDNPLASSKTPRGGQTLVSVAGPYVLPDSVGAVPDGLHTLAALHALADRLKPSGLARGPLRTILQLIHENPHQARATWHNALRAAHRNDPLGLHLLDLMEQLKAFGIEQSQDLPFSPPNTANERFSPLADAMLLADLKSPD